MWQRRGIAFAERAVCQTKPAHMVKRAVGKNAALRVKEPVGPFLLIRSAGRWNIICRSATVTSEAGHLPGNRRGRRFLSCAAAGLAKRPADRVGHTLSYAEPPAATRPRIVHQAYLG